MYSTVVVENTFMSVFTLILTFTRVRVASPLTSLARGLLAKSR